MSIFDASCWRRMLEHLRRHHASICRQWFEQLEPGSLRSGTLTITAGSSLHRSYLRTHCQAAFTEAAQAITGALVSVEFVTAHSQANAPQASHLADDPSALQSNHLPTSATPGDHAPAGNTRRENAAGNGHDDTRPPQTPPPTQSTPQTTTHTPAKKKNHDQSNTRPQPSEPGKADSETTQPSSPASAVAVRHERIRDESDEVPLNPDYLFETFVTGTNNQVAFAAAQAVADQPGVAYNPLFIHGGVGLGKTHLLQAICHKILESRPGARICYLTCEAFRNQFLQCVQRGGEGMDEFRQRYRHVDVLVIDDIHFLADQDRTQEEFFHTFNALYQTNRQIVLSSDSPPSEIPELEERLVSRFVWGLVQRVSKPSFETRVAILRAKADLRGIELPPDVIEYIARRIDSNARELEGKLTQILGHAALTDTEITLELAREALDDSIVAIPRHVNLQDIIEPVIRFYNVKISDLQSKRRHKSITGPRQVCMWLARRRTRLSLEEIGGYFGGRDHTTVMHSIRTVDDRMAADELFAREVEQLAEAIGEGA